jgi:mRNA interferase RelE/StbE
MPKIELSKQAASFLKDLPQKQARQMAEKLNLLAIDPTGLPTETLKGYAPMRRAKSGEFRIIFVIDGEVLQISLIGKRNDDEIYKALQRSWKA